jgi:hypothetical protein
MDRRPHDPGFSTHGLEVHPVPASVIIAAPAPGGACWRPERRFPPAPSGLSFQVWTAIVGVVGCFLGRLAPLGTTPRGIARVGLLLSALVGSGRPRLLCRRLLCGAVVAPGREARIVTLIDETQGPVHLIGLG